MTIYEVSQQWGSYLAEKMGKETVQFLYFTVRRLRDLIPLWWALPLALVGGGFCSSIPWIIGLQARALWVTLLIVGLRPSLWHKDKQYYLQRLPYVFALAFIWMVLFMFSSLSAFSTPMLILFVLCFCDTPLDLIVYSPLQVLVPAARMIAVHWRELLSVCIGSFVAYALLGNVLWVLCVLPVMVAGLINGYIVWQSREYDWYWSA